MLSHRLNPTQKKQSNILRNTVAADLGFIQQGYIPDILYSPPPVLSSGASWREGCALRANNVLAYFCESRQSATYIVFFGCIKD